MVSGEQKLFEAYLVRGAAIARMNNLVAALSDAFKPVFSAFDRASKAFAHFAKMWSVDG